METDGERSYLPFRRKHITDVFSSRTGSFSPARRTSEIPRNSMEFEPADSLFAESPGCGCRRFHSRHKRVIHRCVGILLCIFVLIAVALSATYYFSGLSELQKSSRLQVNVHERVTDKSPPRGVNPAMAVNEKSEEEMEESVESLPPLDAAPPPNRVVADVLFDSREVVDNKEFRPPPTEAVYSDEDPVHIVDKELRVMPSKLWAGDLLQKMRSRRELREQRTTVDPFNKNPKSSDNLFKFIYGDIDNVPVEADSGGSEEQAEAEVVFWKMIQDYDQDPMKTTPQESSQVLHSTETPSEHTVHSTESPSNKVESMSKINELPELLESSKWQELEHYLAFPEDIIGIPTEDNEVDSLELKEVLAEAKMLRKVLHRAKYRFKRALPRQRYSHRKFFKDDCSGGDCNDDVGSARSIPRLAFKKKLEDLLAEIRGIRRKFTVYETRLNSFTEPPFKEFSLVYPTLPPKPVPVPDFPNIWYPEDNEIIPIETRITIPPKKTTPHTTLDEDDHLNEIDSDVDNFNHVKTTTISAKVTSEHVPLTRTTKISEKIIGTTEKTDNGMPTETEFTTKYTDIPEKTIGTTEKMDNEVPTDTEFTTKYTDIPEKIIGTTEKMSNEIPTDTEFNTKYDDVSISTAPPITTTKEDISLPSTLYQPLVTSGGVVFSQTASESINLSSTTESFEYPSSQVVLVTTEVSDKTVAEVSKFTATVGDVSSHTDADASEPIFSDSNTITAMAATSASGDTETLVTQGITEISVVTENAPDISEIPPVTENVPEFTDIPAVTKNVPDGTGTHLVTENAPDTARTPLVPENAPVTDMSETSMVTENSPDISEIPPVTEIVLDTNGTPLMTENVPDATGTHLVTENAPDTTRTPPVTENVPDTTSIPAMTENEGTAESTATIRALSQNTPVTETSTVIESTPLASQFPATTGPTTTQGSTKTVEVTENGLVSTETPATDNAPESSVVTQNPKFVTESTSGNTKIPLEESTSTDGLSRATTILEDATEDSLNPNVTNYDELIHGDGLTPSNSEERLTTKNILAGENGVAELAANYDNELFRVDQSHKLNFTEKSTTQSFLSSYITTPAYLLSEIHSTNIPPSSSPLVTSSTDNVDMTLTDDDVDSVEDNAADADSFIKSANHEETDNFPLFIDKKDVVYESGENIESEKSYIPNYLTSEEILPASNFTATDDELREVSVTESSFRNELSFSTATESYTRIYHSGEVKQKSTKMASGNKVASDVSAADDALMSTTPIGSFEDGEETLGNSKMEQSLDEKMFAEDQDASVTPNPNTNPHGMSLEDARNRKQSSKKFESKVVTASSDVVVPTGPDSAVGVGEAINSGQQLTYTPYQSMVIPFQMCFYANQPMKHGIEPRSSPSIGAGKSLELHPFNLSPLLLPGVSQPSTSKPPMPANVFNIVMNNNAPPPLSPPHMPMVSAPGILSFPSQQHMARYLNGQQTPLFCSAMNSPYQFPTMPGTADAAHTRCRNCDDESFVKKHVDEPVADGFEKDTGVLDCPEGLSRCKDDQLCIPSTHWCDGRVHCGDASDEFHCSCRDRIADVKRCDGYPDCPDAEDEIGCNDCPSMSFSCGTWDEEGACVPLSKRCDGSSDCSNGRDELHCSMLSPTVLNASSYVSFMEGFLLRNWRGVWYPVCSESGQQTWASEACDSNGDPETERRDLPTNVRGPFLTHHSDGDFVLEHHCKGHVALHVSCPPLHCGIRVTDAKPDLSSRFRRLVENNEAPRDADEQPITEWWANLKQQIEKKYGVENVTARIFTTKRDTLPSSSRLEDSFYPVLSEKYKRGISDTGRVVGGKASRPNAWPWAVALYKDGLFHCGGTLLDHEWVLTAAHCVINFSEHYYEANIGMLRRYSFAPMQQIIPITHVVVHRDYEPMTMKNDIAVMRLREPVVMNRWVLPTCLPTSARNRQGQWAPVAGSRCVAVGWGAVKEHGTDPDHLREVEVPILPRCKHREDIEGDEICAGLVQGGKDTCQGDSGGPLMCRDGNASWYVAGIVSHGEGCARPDEAGAYTRVGLYIDWLVSATDSASATQSSMPVCPGFQCTSHPGRCLPHRMRCNGAVDCLGGEDERNCLVHNRFEYMRRSATVAEDDSPIIQSKREQPHHQPPIFNYTSTPNMPDPFKCTKIIQSIAQRRVCDGVQDCEDATDELNCTCRTRILPDKVCDGIIHCADLSDEHDCFTCPDGHFNCRVSKQCVVIEKKCDGVRNCVHGEDEDDCYALTSEFNLVIGANGRPQYESEGVLVENNKGVWSLFCVPDREKLSNKPASTVCRQLGLSGFLQYNPFDASSALLDITDESAEFLSMNIVKQAENCTALTVTCQSSLIGDRGVTKKWEAIVRVNGTPACTAVLLNNNWLLASNSCLPNNYTGSFLVAEVGRHVYPHLMIPINAVKHLNGTDILLLHLDAVLVDSYDVRPIQMPYQQHLDDVTDCVVMGGNRTLPVVLNQNQCPTGRVCVSRTSKSARGCRSQAWSGVAVCNSPDGWLPVAVFTEMAGYCGFQNSVFTDLLPYRKEIDTIMGTPVTPLVSPECDGYLCAGGVCIGNDKICDGRPHCPYADDEAESACLTKNNTGVCGRDELRCENGECVSRAAWSDSTKHCEDGSDEKFNSNCADYLRLTSPDKLCDGSRHCMDKSDEHPSLCHGKGASYNCPSSDVRIPSEFVCDGENDCTGSDDEKHCVTLQRVNAYSKEYEYRNMSYGLWHSVCHTTPSAEAADTLCQAAGDRRHMAITTRLLSPRVVELDHFSSAKLNNLTSLKLRSNRPFAVLKIVAEKCPIAFVTCV